LNYLMLTMLLNADNPARPTTPEPAAGASSTGNNIIDNDIITVNGVPWWDCTR
jgi:hypothetical protein